MAFADYRLVVFDLDFTVWDAGGVWCDYLKPPFRLQDGRVVDSAGDLVRVYEDIPWALETISELGIDLAIASRTTQPEWARDLLELLNLRHYFAHEEIYPSSKLRHFSALKNATGYDYADMLFFDDEVRNIEEVGGLGVRSILVKGGFSRALLEAEIDLSGR